MCFATRPDVLGDKAWQAGLARLRNYDLRCEVEIFSSQLPELKVVENCYPDILGTIELFKPERCMFASHTPIAKLACSFQDLYHGYLNVISGFSISEKRKLFHDTANVIYGLTGLDQP